MWHGNRTPIFYRFRRTWWQKNMANPCGGFVNRILDRKRTDICEICRFGDVVAVIQGKAGSVILTFHLPVYMGLPVHVSRPERHLAENKSSLWSPRDLDDNANIMRTANTLMWCVWRHFAVEMELANKRFASPTFLSLIANEREAKMPQQFCLSVRPSVTVTDCAKTTKHNITRLFAVWIAQSSGKIARVKKLVRMVFRCTNNCLYIAF